MISFTFQKITVKLALQQAIVRQTFIFYKAAVGPSTPWGQLPALAHSSALLEILVTLSE